MMPRNTPMHNDLRQALNREKDDICIGSVLIRNNQILLQDIKGNEHILIEHKNNKTIPVEDLTVIISQILLEA